MISTRRAHLKTKCPQLVMGFTLIGSLVVWQPVNAETSHTAEDKKTSFLSAAPPTTNRFTLANDQPNFAPQKQGIQAGQRIPANRSNFQAECRDGLSRYRVAQSNSVTPSHSTASQWTTLAAIVLLSAAVNHDLTYPARVQGRTHDVFDNQHFMTPVGRENPQAQLIDCRN